MGVHEQLFIPYFPFSALSFCFFKSEKQKVNDLAYVLVFTLNPLGTRA